MTLDLALACNYWMGGMVRSSWRQQRRAESHPDDAGL